MSTDLMSERCFMFFSEQPIYMRVCAYNRFIPFYFTTGTMIQSEVGGWMKIRLAVSWHHNHLLR